MGGFTARGLWGDLGQILQLTRGFGHQCTAWMGLTHKLTLTQAQPLLSQPPFSPYPPPASPHNVHTNFSRIFFQGRKMKTRRLGVFLASCIHPLFPQQGFSAAS